MVWEFTNRLLDSGTCPLPCSFLARLLRRVLEQTGSGMPVLLVWRWLKLSYELVLFVRRKDHLCLHGCPGSRNKFPQSNITPKVAMVDNSYAY